MSILYGYIDLNKKNAEPAVLENMEASLIGYKGDAHTSLITNNVGIGFLNQYVTYESKFDVLPYYSKEDGLYFICDAIIDNRDELIGLLGLKAERNVPDSRIIFESYRKWKSDCTKYLIGDFAFVVYDEKSNMVHLFRDHLGKRLLYYRYDSNQLFFSTLIKPLIDPYALDEKIQINEQYIVEFLSITEIRHEITPGFTIYKGINYVTPASCYTVSRSSISKKIFWDPCKIKENRGFDKKSMVDEFNKIFFEAVRCRLRTVSNVGAFLSGGLDSSSVACVAASLLQKDNKYLNTYTSVPLQGFNKWAPYHVMDESVLVRRIQPLYQNMRMQFIDSKGKDPLNVVERTLHNFEQPYKFIENSYWLEDILQTASSDDCKVILGGVFGNSTISYGSFNTLQFEHLMRMRLVRFIKDFQSFCLHNKLGRKQVASVLMKDIFRSIFYFNEGRHASKYVKNDFQKQYDIEKKMKSHGFTDKPLLRVKDERRLFFHSTLLHQVTAPMAKSCIANNICERDPTGDIRVVEFCLQLPYDCYFDEAKGLDRGLVRQSMQGIVPSIILDNRFRGLQAADSIERIESQWEAFSDAFTKEIQNSYDLSKYIDTPLLVDLLKSNKKLVPSFEAEKDIRIILTFYIYNQFINML